MGIVAVRLVVVVVVVVAVVVVDHHQLGQTPTVSFVTRRRQSHCKYRKVHTLAHQLHNNSCLLRQFRFKAVYSCLKIQSGPSPSLYGSPRGDGCWVVGEVGTSLTLAWR